MLDTLQRAQPRHPVLDKLLHLGPQLGLVQIEVVHGADAQNTLSRKPRADAVHERAARGAEVVGHEVARGDGLGLTEGGQVFAAAQVFEVRVGDGEVGREHGRGDFSTVRAVADEGGDQAWALGWLGGVLVLESRKLGRERSVGNEWEQNQGAQLTNASCTAPQKHVAVASSSLDQPSLALPARGMKGLDVPAAEMEVMIGWLCCDIEILAQRLVGV